VIHLWDAPQIVLDYLRSDTEDLRAAARAAAKAAAWEASWEEFSQRIVAAFPEKDKI
jgi:hypothetical protein